MDEVGSPLQGIVHCTNIKYNSSLTGKSMLSCILMLLVVYGIVIGSADNVGSGISVNDESGKLITPMPSNEVLTDALRSGGNLVGLSQSVNSKGNAYFILEFSNVTYNNCILEYYVKFDFDGKPVKLAIYFSKDLKNWTLLKEDIASIGWHKVSIPRTEHFYVRFEALEPSSGAIGSSFIDEVRIVEGIFTPLDKFDFSSMQVMIAGCWIPITWLVILFLACLVGANVTSQEKTALVSAMLAFFVPFTIDIFFSVNVYFLTLLFRSLYALAINSLLFGAFIGFILSYVLNKRAKHT